MLTMVQSVNRSAAQRVALFVALVLLVSSCSLGDPAPDGDSSDSLMKSETVATPLSEGERDGGDTDPTTSADDSSTTVDESAPSGNAAERELAPELQGDVGLNDLYDPTAGNGGYDVQSYDLQLDWDPESAVLVGVATITAKATQDLGAFNLDLVALQVGGVTVDGVEATSSHDGDELTIVPAAVIGDGDEMEVVVSYHGTPQSANKGITEIGWRFDGKTVVALGEPEGASYWYPVNDHPSDKATYTFEVTTDSSLVVAANGQLEIEFDNGDGTTTWNYVGEGLQVPHATILSIGDYDIIDGGEVAGVTIRHFVPPSTDAAVRAQLEGTAADIVTLTEALGPYPFETYGYLLIEGDFPGALETQTLTAISADLVGPVIRRHELAHAWFGNSVSIESWSDIWLAEGFATYFADAPFRDSVTREADARFLEQLVAPNFGLLHPAPADPGNGLRDLFGFSTYVRGAAALGALRYEVGGETFDQIIATYIERYEGGNATTADFIAVAEEVSATDLSELFDVWLYAVPLPDEWEGIAFVEAG